MSVTGILGRLRCEMLLQFKGHLKHLRSGEGWDYYKLALQGI